MTSFFNILLFIVLLLCSSCSANYLVLSEEGIGQYTSNGKTNTFIVPKNKGVKVRKKSKLCYRMYWGTAYVGILCNPDIRFLGKMIPDGITEIDSDDFLRMKNGGDGTDKSVQSTTPNSNINSLQSTTPNSSERTYHTGPRGGQYYINSKGNKTYKRRK